MIIVASANNFNLVYFALLPYFERDGIRNLRTATANIAVKRTNTTALKGIE